MVTEQVGGVIEQVSVVTEQVGGVIELVGIS